MRKPVVVFGILNYLQVCHLRWKIRELKIRGELRKRRGARELERRLSILRARE